MALLLGYVPSCPPTPPWIRARHYCSLLLLSADREKRFRNGPERPVKLPYNCRETKKNILLLIGRFHNGHLRRPNYDGDRFRREDTWRV